MQQIPGHRDLHVVSQRWPVRSVELSDSTGRPIHRVAPLAQNLCNIGACVRADEAAGRGEYGRSDQGTSDQNIETQRIKVHTKHEQWMIQRSYERPAAGCVTRATCDIAAGPVATCEVAPWAGRLAASQGRPPRVSPAPLRDRQGPAGLEPVTRRARAGLLRARCRNFARRGSRSYDMGGCC